MTPTQRHYFEMAIINALDTWCDMFHRQNKRWPTQTEMDAFETQTRRIWS